MKSFCKAIRVVLRGEDAANQIRHQPIRRALYLKRNAYKRMTRKSTNRCHLFLRRVEKKPMRFEDMQSGAGLVFSAHLLDAISCTRLVGVY